MASQQNGNGSAPNLGSAPRGFSTFIYVNPNALNDAIESIARDEEAPTPRDGEAPTPLSFEGLLSLVQAARDEINPVPITPRTTNLRFWFPNNEAVFTGRTMDITAILDEDIGPDDFVELVTKKIAEHRAGQLGALVGSITYGWDSGNGAIVYTVHTKDAEGAQGHAIVRVTAKAKSAHKENYELSLHFTRQ